MTQSSGEDSEQTTSSRKREDGRKALLVYLPPDLIKELKKAGLDDDRNVYEIVDEASREWLSRRGKQVARMARRHPCRAGQGVEAADVVGTGTNSLQPPPRKEESCLKR